MIGIALPFITRVVATTAASPFDRPGRAYSKLLRRRRRRRRRRQESTFADGHPEDADAEAAAEKEGGEAGAQPVPKAAATARRFSLLISRSM